jgi:hypothetical protein
MLRFQNSLNRLNNLNNPNRVLTMKRTWVSRISVFVALIGLTVLPAAAQQMGRVRVEVQPRRAGVFIDGEYVGPATNHGTVRRYSLPPGQYEITLRDSGFADASTMVTIQAGQTTTISQSLEPLDLAEPPFGTLRTRNSDRLAAVYINDRFMGHVDEFNNVTQGMLLNPGEYEIRIVRRDGTETTETATIEEGETTIVGSNN